MIFRPLDWAWEARALQEYCNAMSDVDALMERVRKVWRFGEEEEES